MKLLKNEWEIREIPLPIADKFVEQWHYAQKAGKVAHKCFGLFYKGDPYTLHGVSVWNVPPLGAAKSVDKCHRNVLALSRFCLIEGRPENAGSFLISKSIKSLDSRKWRTLLTYADTALNHNGGLYRASNWTYEGLTGKNPMFWDPINNCMKSRKSGANNYSKTQMLKMGYEFKGNFAKHKFIYPIKKVRRPQIQDGTQLELNFTEKGNIIIPLNLKNEL